MLSFAFAAITIGAPSPFWNGIDALCRKPEAVAVLQSSTDADSAALREQTFNYCRYQVPPRFAARPEAERMATLAKVYATVNLGAVPAADMKLAIADAAPDLDKWVEDQTRLEPKAELGPLGEQLLSAALGEVCRRLPEGHGMAITCSLSNEKRVTVERLRLALVRDLLVWAGRGADATFGLAAAALAHEDPRAWGEPLARAIESSICTVDASAKGVACERGKRAAAIAMAMITRIGLDNAKVDRPLEHYVNLFEEVLRDESKNANLTLSDPAKAAIQQLVRALQNVDQQRALVARAHVTDVARASFALAESAVLVGLVSVATIDTAAVGGAKLEAPAADTQPAIAKVHAFGEGAIALLEASSKTDVPALLRVLRPTLEANVASGKLTSAELKTIDIAAQLSTVRSSADVKRVARDALLPLPPWIDRVAFDLNVSPPEFKSAHGNDNVSINGDITLGYNGDRFGFMAHADSAYYQVESGSNTALTERYAGWTDVWGLVDLSKSVKLDMRLSLAGAYYGTLADDQVGGADRKTSQDSIFLRGGGLVGVRVSEPRWAFGVWLGGGAQYEDYYRVLLVSTGDLGSNFNAAVGARLEGRVRGQVAIVPQILTFRARVDATRFQMRRDDQAVNFSVGNVTAASQGVVELEQYEIMPRAFLDLDFAKFVGFTPAAHGGVNVFILNGGGAGTSAVVPVFGIGVRREAL